MQSGETLERQYWTDTECMEFCGWVLDTTDQIEYALKNKYLFKVRTVVENN